MSHVVRSTTLRFIVLVAVCAALTVTAFAQSNVTGAIAGTVSDQSKAVVVGAKVTIRNIDTNFQASAVTDAQGKFRVAQLQPGTYSVKADAANFAAGKPMQVRVEVGRISELELVVAVAGKQETVEVTSEAPVVNTMQQDFATNLSTEAISNLPINGRRWSQYALLTPGATPDGNFGLISFRGISGLLNNNTVDGGDNNQAFFSEERGRTRAAYVISQSSVREFQVNTSNYSAEYGRAAGAVVNSVTKSGTNKIHGEGFWYIRDNELGAINPFWIKTVQNPDGTFTSDHFKPEDRRQQFGGNIGGPIVKDKLFFFFNYDGQRRNFPGVGLPGNPSQFWTPITVSDPTVRNAAATCSALKGVSGAKAPTGFTATDGEMLFCRGITQAQVDGTMGQLLAMTGQTPRRGDQDIFFPKLDWRVNNNNSLSLSYNRMRWNSPAGVQTQPTVKYAIDAFGNDYVKDDIIIGRLSSTITNNLVNEFRVTWGRDFEFQTSQDPVGMEKNFATGYGGRAPNIYISSGGGLNLGRSAFLERYAYPDEKRAQWADTMNLVHGKHFMKWGFDMSRNDDKMDNLYTGGGAYTYNNRADFIADVVGGTTCNNWSSSAKTNTPMGCYSSFKQAFGPSRFQFQNWDYAFFVQDDYRVLPRLTVSFGMRYEYEQLPSTQIPNPSLPLTIKFPRDTNNFGPRVGFALDVFGDGKTSLRGGYGMYYGRIINAAMSNAITNTGMSSGQITYSWNAYSSGAPVFPNVVTKTGSSTTPAALMFSNHLQNPQIHQFDLILEHEIAKNTMMSVSYMGSLGRELPQYIDTNLAPSTYSVTMKFNDGPYAGQSFQMPVYTARKNPNFTQLVTVFSNVNSNYNALVAQVSRRMTKGLQFQGNYTWSHALDFNQESQTSNTASRVFDPYCIDCEYGTSNFDIRHKFVGSAVWQPTPVSGKGVSSALLNGWSISPIFAFSSGVPYTEYVASYVRVSGVPSGMSGINNGSGYSHLPTLGRNSWRQPWIQNIDLRLARSFKIKERHSVEFLAEAFNLFNHQQITGVNNQMYTISSPTCTIGTPCTATLNYSPEFGTFSQAGATLYRERNVQFGIKYAF